MLCEASRSGAWLADFIHTLMAIEKGDVQSKASYYAVHNSPYVWLCKEVDQEHSHYCSASNVGNVFEWLVWAASEEKRYDFVASLTAHAATGHPGQASAAPDVFRQGPALHPETVQGAPALQLGLATGDGAPCSNRSYGLSPFSCTFASVFPGVSACLCQQ